MKKYVVFFFLDLLIVLCPLSVSAQIFDYSDDYVSFSYDDEMLGKISIMTHYGNDHYIEYDFSFADRTEDPVSFCMLCLQNKDENYDESQYEPVLSGKNGRDINIIQNDDDFLVFTSKTSNLDNSPYQKYIDIIFDSLSFSDFDSIDSSLVSDGDVFVNINISDQATIYAKAGIDILNGYMKMEIGPDDASDQINELITRIENYLDGDTEYYFDREIKYPFSLVDLYLSSGKDDKILEVVHELEDLIGTD